MKTAFKNSKQHYLLSGFQKIDTNLQELMACFREVLEELGQKKIAAHLPWSRPREGEDPAYQSESSPSKTHPHEGETSAILGLEQAYSVAFQLLNIVEANAATQTRRLREIGSGLTAERGLWGEQLSRLKSSGYTEKEIAAFLSQVCVEPVFTAHPTEAKRGAVLEQHRMLHQLLASADQGELTPSEKKENRRQIKLCLEKLWRSGEIFLEQPSIDDERREILFYFREILPKTILALDERLRAAWEEVGFSPALLAEAETMPQLHFGTWVGGDRDGHPFVTAAVTQETLLELRRRAIALLHRSFDQLSNALPLSRHFQQPSEELLQSIEQFSEELGITGKEIENLYRDEPWRQFALLIQAKLPSKFKKGEQPNRDQNKIILSSTTEVRSALEILVRSLNNIDAQHLVENSLRPLFRLLDVFGFHLAKLDIRQNSNFHDRALQQILQAAAVPDADSFLEWNKEKRLAFFHQELASPKKLRPLDSFLGEEATAVLECYRILQQHAENFGYEGIGSLIVSMTHCVSDLLAVVILAREAGLAKWNGKTLYSPIPIVPLFESRQDLKNAAGIIESWLREPSCLASRQFKLPVEVKDKDNNFDNASLLHPQLSTSTSAQQVMIGYSDSNKDCGIIASQWELHEAQRKMALVGKKQNVKLQFFHGRGGTISRGAGPTDLFLQALPQGSLQGDLRMTEQGETIAQKYPNSSTATYHLELLLAGVAGASLPREKKKNLESFCIAEFLAEESCSAYQKLIQTEGFMNFYEQATPLDALEASRIGSRPKRRSAQRSLTDLRAIPWVFSWNQARYFLPGWFGVGSALSALEEKKPSLFKALQKNHRSWPFLNYLLSNVETNLASAHLSLMEKYASLVTDASIRTRLFFFIVNEFQKTEHQLKKILGGSFKERRPRMAKTLALRAEALKFLHEHQIRLLKKWRAARETNPSEAEQLLPQVLLSINAIASGLRTTG